MTRIIVACGGGPGSLKAVGDLQAPGVEVVAVAVDTGQGGSVASLRDTAIAAGAARVHTLDARDEFARAFLMPALHGGLRPRAGGLLDDLARALVAEKLAAVAALEQAGTIVIGAPDQRVRALLTTAIAACDSTVVVTAVPSRRLRLQAAPPVRIPTGPATVRVAFDRGVPVAVNGVAMPLVDLLESLSTIAAGHGVGRPGRTTGVRTSRPDLPAICVLAAARDAVAGAVLAREDLRFCDRAAVRYAALVRRGDWFSPLRCALGAFARSIQERITGTVTLILAAGGMTVSDVSSPYEVGRRRPVAAEVGAAIPAASDVESQLVTP
jgi:argininosuccinate synthase